MQLQSEMTRFHESKRPRYSNPTYASTNVGSSLGLNVPHAFRSLPKDSQPSELMSDSRHGLFQAQTDYLRSRKSLSHLSSYGTNSLTSLPKLITDKQVYQKQQKRYNIINVQPKEYQDTINLYPKYRLQNIDEHYYKKLQIESQISLRNNERKMSNHELCEPFSPTKLNPERHVNGKLKIGKQA